MGGSLGLVRESGRSPRLLPEQGAHGSWLLQLHSGGTLMCVTPRGGLSTVVGVLSSRCERVGSCPSLASAGAAVGSTDSAWLPRGEHPGRCLVSCAYKMSAFEGALYASGPFCARGLHLKSYEGAVSVLGRKRLVTHSSVHLFTHSFVHSFTHSLTFLFTHSFVHCSTACVERWAVRFRGRAV